MTFTTWRMCCSFLLISYIAFFFISLDVTTTTADKGIDEAINLNSFPFVTSHDAASGELDESRDHVLADWTRTQTVGLIGQLDCGSRAYDYRPHLSSDGTLLAHHGPVVIHKPMNESLKEIVSWLSIPDNQEEMIIMYITDCDGADGCIDKTKDLLSSNDIYFVDNCEDLNNLTYGDVKTLGRLKSGGSFLGIIGCTDENYDVSISCYGREPSKYSCYNSESSDIAFQKMDDYMLSITSADPVSISSNLWMAQAHWQSDAYSVSVGTLHNSSVIEDSNRSDLNNWVLQQLRENKWSFINLLELDNVCNQGLEIQQILLEYAMRKAR